MSVCVQLALKLLIKFNLGLGQGWRWWVANFMDSWIFSLMYISKCCEI